MAEIGHVVSSSIVTAVSRTNQAYGDVGHSISTGNFTASEDYWLLWTGHMGTSNKNHNTWLKWVQGSGPTDIAPMEIGCEIGSAFTPDAQVIGASYKWNAADEIVKTQGKNTTASGTVYLDQSRLIAFNVNGLASNIFNYAQDDEISTPTGLTTSYVDRVTTTWTPDAATYLVVGYVNFGGASIGEDAHAQMVISGGATRTVEFLIREGEDSSNFWPAMWGALVTFTNTSSTVKIQVKENSASTWTHRFSSVAALKLEHFNDSDFFTSTATPANNTASWAEFLTVDAKTPSQTGNVVYLTSGVIGPQGGGGHNQFYARMQESDADVPAPVSSDSWTGDDREMNHWSGADDVSPFMMLDYENWTSGALTLDLDTYANSTAQNLTRDGMGLILPLELGTAGGEALAGTIAGSGDLTGNLTSSTSLSGTIAGSGDLTGDLTSTTLIAGSIAGTGDLTGNLTSTTLIAGSIAGTGDLTGNLTSSTSLSGTIAGTGDLTGNLTSSSPLAGSIAGTGDLTGNLTSTELVAGTIAGTGDLTGNLTSTTLIAGSIAGTGDLTGNLTSTTALSGSIAGTGDLTGTLTPPAGVEALEGTIAGTGDLTGNLTSSTALSGSIAGSGDLTGNLTSSSPLAGSIAGTGDLTGDLTSTTLIAGSIAGTGDLTGNLTSTTSLAGTIAGTGDLTGTLTPPAGIEALEGTIAGTGDLVGDLINLIGSATVIKDISPDKTRQTRWARSADLGGGGTDNWPVTWADDGYVYMHGGDGGGFENGAIIIQTISVWFLASDQSINRNTGSFITDGYEVNMWLDPQTGTNTGPWRITSVAATKVIMDAGTSLGGPGSETIVDEGSSGSPVSPQLKIGSEKGNWFNRIESDFTTFLTDGAPYRWGLPNATPPSISENWGKTYSLMSIDGDIYVWKGDESSAFIDIQRLLKSTDKLATEPSESGLFNFVQSTEPVGAPSFIQFGQDFAKPFSGHGTAATDTYIYCVTAEIPDPDTSVMSMWEPGILHLMRADKTAAAFETKSNWEWFAGMSGGSPTWDVFANRVPILESRQISGILADNFSSFLSCIYHPGLKVYITTLVAGTDAPPAEFHKTGAFLFLEADEPWGPWRIIKQYTEASPFTAVGTDSGGVFGFGSSSTDITVFMFLNFAAKWFVDDSFVLIGTGGGGGALDACYAVEGSFTLFTWPLAGSIDGTGGLTGDVVATKPLAGTIAGTGGLTGNSTSTTSLSGSIDGVGDLNANLTVVGAPVEALAGSIGGAGSLVGDLTSSTTLAGSIAGTGNLVGFLKEDFVTGVKLIWDLDSQGDSWSLDHDDAMTWKLDFLS